MVSVHLYSAPAKRRSQRENETKFVQCSSGSVLRLSNVLSCHHLWKPCISHRGLVSALGSNFHHDFGLLPGKAHGTQTAPAFKERRREWGGCVFVDRQTHISERLVRPTTLPTHDLMLKTAELICAVANASMACDLP